MNEGQVVELSMQQYGIPLNLGISTGEFSSLLLEINKDVEAGHFSPEAVRQTILDGLLLEYQSISIANILNPEDIQFSEIFLINCSLVLAFDAFLASKPLNFLTNLSEQNLHVAIH